MKITVTLTTTQKVEQTKEIALPYYSRSETCSEFFKVFGEGKNDCLKIFNNLTEDYKEGFVNIRNRQSSSDALNESLIECTEQEWTEQFERAILYFQTINRADDL